MKDQMNQHGQDGSFSTRQADPVKKPNTKNMGEYIDFEDVK
jgi:hypothetical protein